MASPLITAQSLMARLSEPRLRVLDTSWYVATVPRNAHAEFRAGHIPRAQYFDLDEASDPDTSLPHMMPPAHHFEAYVESLGISTGDDVVVYDASGANLSAARAWWMFRAMGHEKVWVLDGGLAAWKQAGGPLESGEAPVPPPGTFHARPGAMPVASFEDVRDAVSRGGQVVDMRSRGRFEGTEPEPRSGLRSGRAPGSRNIPYGSFVDGEGKVRPPDELRKILSEQGIDTSRPIIATCGSGVSACNLVLALDVLGAPRPAVYDGSWSEWGQRDDTEVATGPA